MLKVRRAVYEDIPNIMRFMDEHWKPGNILAKDRNFFEWQFVDGDKVNMFIGIDEEEGKIYGMLGVILYSRSEHPDIAGCAWQTIKSSNPRLGMALQDYMWEQILPRYTDSIGLSKKATKIYTLLGFTPIVMDHYYRIADREQYEIADIVNKKIPKVEDTGYSLVRISFLEDMKRIISEEELKKQVMSKDYEYIERRYFSHPVYSYDIWKVIDDKNLEQAVLITREEEVNGKRMCKIIDYYGDLEHIEKITFTLDSLMKEREYEYIDVYSYGVPIEIYEKAGFLSCTVESSNIIPNYFHPFVRDNIEIRMMEPMCKEVRMFRGDGDQDRPC